VGKRPAEAVEPPHDEGVAGAKVVEHPVELGPVVERPAGLVGPHPDAASRLQAVGLKVRLLLDGADPGVTELVSHPTSVSKTVVERVDGTLISDTGFGTVFGPVHHTLAGWSNTTVSDRLPPSASRTRS